MIQWMQDDASSGFLLACNACTSNICPGSHRCLGDPQLLLIMMPCRTVALPPVTTATVDWSHHLFSMAKVLVLNALRSLRSAISLGQQGRISHRSDVAVSQVCSCCDLKDQQRIASHNLRSRTRQTKLVVAGFGQLAEVSTA